MDKRVLIVSMCAAGLVCLPALAMHTSPATGASFAPIAAANQAIELQNATVLPPQPPHVDERGTEAHPIIVRAIPEPADEVKAKQDSLIAWSTVVLAVVTALLTIFTGLLWWWTKQLARDAIEGGKAQAESTKQLLEISRASADAAKASADMASESNRLTRELFIAENRPWLTIEIESGGGLTWDEDGLNLPVLFTVRNVGATPALHASVQAHPYPQGPGSGEPVVVQLQIAAHARNKPAINWGDTIFPNEDLTFQFSYKVPKVFFTDMVERMRQQMGNSVSDESFSLNFVGCIDYQFGSGSGRGSTGFIREVARSSGTSPNEGIVFGVDVPRDQVRFNKLVVSPAHID